MDWTPSAETTIEELAPGLTLERLHADKLWVFHLKTVPTREVVDAWVAGRVYYRHRIMEPSTDRFLIYDAEQMPRLQYTPYFQEKSRELANSDPHVTGRLGLVAPVSGTFRAIMQLFMRRAIKKYQPHLDYGVFNRYAEALAWVEEDLFRKYPALGRKN